MQSCSRRDDRCLKTNNKDSHSYKLLHYALFRCITLYSRIYYSLPYSAASHLLPHSVNA